MDPFTHSQLQRRAFLGQAGLGFGGLALSAMLQSEGFGKQAGSLPMVNRTSLRKPKA